MTHVSATGRSPATLRADSRSRSRGTASLLGTLALVLLLLGPVRALGATTSSTTFSVASAADSYVSSRYPASNFGTESVLRIAGSPKITTYLRFNIEGGVGAVAGARLRLFAKASSSAGYEVRGVSDS